MHSIIPVPVLAPERPSEPGPLADDLGRMWGRETAESATDGGEGASRRAAAPSGPSSKDRCEREEIGEAVADLDNPPADDRLLADARSDAGKDRAKAPGAGSVTGSWA
ncbi:MAG: hypothetical protein ACRCVA_15505 [Phreatobacter sp.]